MNMRAKLIDELAQVTGWPTREEVADVVIDTFDTHGWHGPEDCDAEDEHRATSLLSEAVRRLHKQAHNGPRDSLYAENCRTEPCVSVADLLEAADVITSSALGPAA